MFIIGTMLLLITVFDITICKITKVDTCTEECNKSKIYQKFMFYFGLFFIIISFIT